jgi:hypothetical protein
MGKPAPHFRMTGLSNRTKASRLSTARENPPRGNPSFEPWLGGQHGRGPCDGNCAPRRACHRAARVARTWSVHPSSLMAPGLSGFARKPVSREDHESICLWPNPATPGDSPSVRLTEARVEPTSPAKSSCVRSCTISRSLSARPKRRPNASSCLATRAGTSLSIRSHRSSLVRRSRRAKTPGAARGPAAGQQSMPATPPDPLIRPELWSA